MIEVSTNNETNAGICPEYDPDRPWQYPDTKADKYYPPELPAAKHSFCGETAESICTFPFSVSESPDISYIPYKDSPQNFRCGTKDTDLVPIDYSVHELDTAVPCEGE